MLAFGKFRVICFLLTIVLTFAFALLSTIKSSRFQNNI